jgi:hypothetical protein
MEHGVKPEGRQTLTTTFTPASNHAVGARKGFQVEPKLRVKRMKNAVK